MIRVQTKKQQLNGHHGHNGHKTPSSAPLPIIALAGLQTEDRNPNSTNIDRVSTQELCRILNREDVQVPKAVEPCIPVIAETIDVLSKRVRNGGRVFYIGAGTSGRLGVLDASEIPPTYSAPTDQFVALIAGGDNALRYAAEGAEDSRNAAEEDLRALDFDSDADSLIGIASSGRTPYVLGGLSFARSMGATTVGIVCVEPSAVGAEGNADYLITAVTGPEVVTGSTRMKAGTATKLVLNMISTGIMIKLGKTYGNLMIDLKATNHKLEQRSKNILRVVGGTASATKTDEELGQILAASHGSVKLAAATIVLGVPVCEAEKRLRRNNGLLARVFEESRAMDRVLEKPEATQDEDEGLVLCVDAGGTSCKAVVISRSAAVGMGSAGPCNVSNVGLDRALSTVSKAIQEALDSNETTQGRPLHTLTFSSAWVGIAGHARPALTKLVDTGLSNMIRLPAGRRVKVTSDSDVLPVSMAAYSELHSVVVLVAGTGSVAMSYVRVDGGFQRVDRVGGWGYLLGDDGAGYGLGREALRLALQCSDAYRMRRGSGGTQQDFLPLYRAIVAHFQAQYPASKPEDLLSTVLVPDHALHQDADATLATTKRIASVARVVLSLAESDTQAQRIADAGVASLVRLVSSLVEAQRGTAAGLSSTGLVLAGGLMQNGLYKSKVLEAIRREVGLFGRVETVTEPALAGARYLREVHI